MRTSIYALCLGVSAVLGACGDDGEAGGGGGGPTNGGGPTGGNAVGAGDTGGAGGEDTTAPVTTFGSAPSEGHSAARASAFQLVCSEPSCSWECSLDGAAFAPCSDAPSFDLPPGSYTLAVRATDAAGNVEATPKEHAWTVVFGWRDTAASYDSACAISWDQRLYCWGQDYDGQLGNGPGSSAAVSLPTQVGTASDWEELFPNYAGYCARNAASELHCWGQMGPLGDPNYGVEEAPVPRFNGYTKIVANYDASCALDTTGALSCMGYSSDGLLGDGDLSSHYLDVPTVVGSDTYKDLAMGDEHACAVRDDGRLLCWGAIPLGASSLAVPTPVDAATDWESVAAGSGHTCAVKTSGTLFCWGYDWSGQLGQGALNNEPTPVQVGTDTDWARVNGSDSSTCGSKVDGTTLCWGDHREGQLGSTVAPLDLFPTPTPVSGGAGYIRVSGMGDHLCGETVDGFVRCWGRNEEGVLARGVGNVQTSLALLDSQFDAISTTEDAGGCGISAGKLLCWGFALSNGQPLPTALPKPTQVGSDSDWSEVSVSRMYPAHACGIRAGNLYCWGDNDYGQVGDGTTIDVGAPKPITVPGVAAWSHVTTGAYESCALSSAGEIFCWGNNNYGQLGIGNSVAQSAPVKLAGSGWDDVNLGFFRASAHKSDGTIWIWGVNSGATPTVLPDSDWAKIGETGFAECAIKTNGTLHCTQQAVPGIFAVGAATNWVDTVTVGYPFCALDDQGAVSCFVPSGNGFNTSPSVQDGTGWLSLEVGGVTCGLKAGKERHCRGVRHLGSLGDGFDERLPTVIATP